MSTTTYTPSPVQWPDEWTLDERSEFAKCLRLALQVTPAHRRHIQRRRAKKRMRAFADACYDTAGAVKRFAKALESLNEQR